MRRTWGLLVVAAWMLTALCAAPAAADPAAAAAIAGSSITAPANGTELFYDGDNGSGSATVTGTVTGAGAGSTADLRCYYDSDSTSIPVMTGIDVSSGQFSLNVSLADGPQGNALPDKACRLRLVPSGMTPTGSAAAPFAGPAISVNDIYTYSETGNVFGYSIFSGTLPWAFQLESAGQCPVAASYATDPSTLSSYSLFAGNACLPAVSGLPPNLNSRAALQVDGVDAFLPGAIAGTSPNDLSGVPGFRALAYSPRFNARHTSVTIDETETPVFCSPLEVFPPDAVSCPRLVPAGLTVTQRTSLTDGGQVARVQQTITNVDTRSHTVDLLFSQSVVGDLAKPLSG